MAEAFDRASKEAEQEYGTDIYNGQINNCQLGRDVTRLRKDHGTTEEFHEWILNNTHKRMVYGYCVKEPIANTNTTKSTVERFPQKGSRKFETRYVAVPKFGHQMRIPISEKTQGDAIKKAREYVEKHPDVIIDIMPKKVLVEGGGLVATVKYKPSSKEREGEYIFVGWAPE